MESRADYVAAKVAENLSYEALLAIVGAVCPSPNQTAKTCLELGIAPEGEKVAKWVAVLKRELPSSRDFLGTLKRIYDQKTEAESMAAKSLEEVSQETGVKIIDKIADAVERLHLNVRRTRIHEKRAVNEEQIQADLKYHFIDPWMRRLEERIKRIKFGGRKGSVVCSAKYQFYSFKYASEKDIFPENVRIFDCEISLSHENHKLLIVDLGLDIKAADVRGAYKRIPFSKAEIKISVAADRLVRQARALAKWMAKNNAAKVIEIEGRTT